MDAVKRPDSEELRVMVPRDLFVAIDGIAQAEATTRTDLVNRWLAEKVRQDLHAATLKVRVLKGNALMPQEQRTGGAD